jgi:hypothetical protein
MNEVLVLFILLICGTAGVVAAVAGETAVNGRMVITKVMTRKRVTLPSYDLVAWHRSAGFFRRHITLGEGATSGEDSVIPVKDLDAGAAHKPGSSQ